MTNLRIILCILSVGLLQAATSNPLRSFFDELTISRGRTKLPTVIEVLTVTDLIPEASVQVLKDALPAILRAFADKNDEVKKDALIALYAIATRGDGAALLQEDLLQVASSLYSSTDANVQRGAILMILALKPRPPKEAVPILLTYLRSGRASEDVKSSLVSGLVRLAPAAPEVVQAVSDVMAQKLKAEARIEILNALGEPAVESPVLIDRMIDAMDDPNRAVQLTAVAAVKRNGLKATSRAASVLLRLANTATDADIRKAAREALEGGQSC